MSRNRRLGVGATALRDRTFCWAAERQLPALDSRSTDPAVNFSRGSFFSFSFLLLLRLSAGPAPAAPSPPIEDNGRVFSWDGGRWTSRRRSAKEAAAGPSLSGAGAASGWCRQPTAARRGATRPASLIGCRPCQWTGSRRQRFPKAPEAVDSIFSVRVCVCVCVCVCVRCLVWLFFLPSARPFFVRFSLSPLSFSLWIFLKEPPLPSLLVSQFLVKNSSRPPRRPCTPDLLVVWLFSSPSRFG